MLDAIKQFALDELVKLFVIGPDTWVSGRTFRGSLTSLGSDLKERRAAAESLVPDWAEHSNVDSNDDLFRPTLSGLLKSYPHTAEIVDSTLGYFRERYKLEPGFRTFSWHDLKVHLSRSLASGKDGQEFSQVTVRNVLEVAGLSLKWYGQEWGTPDAIEELVGVSDLQELLLWQGMVQETQSRSVDSVRLVENRSPAKRLVFIGHGHSPLWRELKDFIHDRLNLDYDEFNREPTAGLSTKERLQKMLDEAMFAFLIMTGEDERTDGTKTARANVIHEIGLLQGRLGFERAIVLLEVGCEEFSNIVGISQIRFPKGNISAVFEEIRRVLEREQVLPKT